MKISKTKAIIEFCKECCGDQKPRDCTSINCQLYQFRISKASQNYIRKV